MEFNMKDVHDAIKKIYEFKRKGKTEKEELVFICTELAIMKQEKRSLEEEIREMQATIEKLKTENKLLKQMNTKQTRTTSNEIEIQCDILRNNLKQSRHTQTESSTLSLRDESCQARVFSLSVHCGTEDLNQKKSQETQTKPSFSYPSQQTTQQIRPSYKTNLGYEKTEESNRRTSFPPIAISKQEPRKMNTFYSLSNDSKRGFVRYRDTQWKL